ncbi:hypothetical protein [Serratia ficaria]|uniref:hypothetical protein n=1 Tax=Serratia ficaria TaxID=61651 RepID=UPI00077C8B02|nr:hypothetical protein [Serratia ficaria]
MFKRLSFFIGFLLGTFLKRWKVVFVIILLLIGIAQMLTVAQMGELRCSGLDYIILGDFNDACKMHRAWRSN